VDDHGDIYSFSVNALSPDGINQYCGNYPLAPGVGQPTTLKELPDEVQEAIIRRLN